MNDALTGHEGHHVSARWRHVNRSFARSFTVVRCSSSSVIRSFACSFVRSFAVVLLAGRPAERQRRREAVGRRVGRRVAAACCGALTVNEPRCLSAWWCGGRTGPQGKVSAGDRRAQRTLPAATQAVQSGVAVSCRLRRGANRVPVSALRCSAQYVLAHNESNKNRILDFGNLILRQNFQCFTYESSINKSAAHHVCRSSAGTRPVRCPLDGRHQWTRPDRRRMCCTC